MACDERVTISMPLGVNCCVQVGVNTASVYADVSYLFFFLRTAVPGHPIVIKNEDHSGCRAVLLWFPLTWCTAFCPGPYLLLPACRTYFCTAVPCPHHTDGTTIKCLCRPSARVVSKRGSFVTKFSRSPLACPCTPQGVRAIVELVRHGANTTVFVSSTVLCIAWATASVLRSRDHWREAAKEPSIGSDGLPTRRKLWWVFWPFYNLSFMTAMVAVIDRAGHDGKSWSGVVSVMADDRLWNVVALALALAFVSYSVAWGAEVTLCTRKPNGEFTAGFLSAGLFSWFSSVIDIGQKKQLDFDDLPMPVRNGYTHTPAVVES